jgi:hypothetical protein
MRGFQFWFFFLKIYTSSRIGDVLPPVFDKDTSIIRESGERRTRDQKDKKEIPSFQTHLCDPR